MGKYDKLLERILLGDADANIKFDELCQLLLRLGFEERIRGSHHIYRHGSKGRTTVPVHANQDLKPGTQRGIMRDAGLTDDDL